MTNNEIFNYYKENVPYALTKKGLPYSKETIKQYEPLIELFINSLNDIIVGGVEVLAVNRKHVMAVSKRLHLSPSANYKMVSAVSHFYTFLIDDLMFEDKIQINPTLNVPRNAGEPKQKIPLDREVVEKLIKACNNDRDVAVFTTLFATGMRISELAGLSLKQYQNRDKYGKIILEHTKGNKTREIYLNTVAIKAIDKYLEVRKQSEYENLFLTNRGTPITQDGTIKVLKRLGKKLQAQGETDMSLDHLTNHLFRTSFATDKLNQGFNLSVLQQVLGHSNISTTTIYAKINSNSVRDLMLANA